MTIAFFMTYEFIFIFHPLKLHYNIFQPWHGDDQQTKANTKREGKQRIRRRQKKIDDI